MTNNYDDEQPTDNISFLPPTREEIGRKLVEVNKLGTRHHAKTSTSPKAEPSSLEIAQKLHDAINEHIREAVACGKPVRLEEWLKK